MCTTSLTNARLSSLIFKTKYWLYFAFSPFLTYSWTTCIYKQRLRPLTLPDHTYLKNRTAMTKTIQSHTPLQAANSVISNSQSTVVLLIPYSPQASLFYKSWEALHIWHQPGLSSATGSFENQGWLETFLSHFHLHQNDGKMRCCYFEVMLAIKICLKFCTYEWFARKSIFLLKAAHNSKDYVNIFYNYFPYVLFKIRTHALLTED